MKHVLFLAMPYEAGESGISRYIQATLKAMVGKYRLTIYALNSDIPALQSLIPNAQYVNFCAVSERFAGALANIFWFHVVLPRVAKRLHQDTPLSAVFFPAGNRRLCPVLNKVLPDVESWVTIHDLAPLRLKKYDVGRQWYTTKYLPHCYRQEKRLFAISQQTADDLVELAGVSSRVITVNFNGYEPLVSEDSPVNEDALDVLNLKGPFVLFTGRLEYPAKNHLGLIEAWSQLPISLQQKYTLVFVGKDWCGADRIHQAVTDYHRQVPEGCIRTLGFVSDVALAALYAHATLYVQPSLYEGFGLPLLEAMAAQTPVLSSNRGALPEVGGDTVTYTEPDAVSMTVALQSLLRRCDDKDLDLRVQVERAKARVNRFSWQEHISSFATNCKSSELQLMNQSLFNGSREHFLTAFTQKKEQGERQKVFFMNADCFNLNTQQPEYAKALKEAHWLLPDGSGVALAGWLTGQRLLENLNGTDLFPDLCALSEQKKWKVFFLGARSEVVDALCENIKCQYPQLQIHGSHSGFFTPEQTPDIVAKIAGADLLFVGMGAPLQEQWIQKHWDNLEVSAAFAVGGLFDFYSGRIARAPLLWRRLGVEWIWRMLQEPGRLWRRYLLGNPLFLYRVLRWRASEAYSGGVKQSAMVSSFACD